MRPLIVTATLALFIASCAGSDDAGVNESTSDVATTGDVGDSAPAKSEPPSTEPPGTDLTTTGAPESDPAADPGSTEPLELEQSTDAMLEDPFSIVEQLAGDE